MYYSHWWWHALKTPPQRRNFSGKKVSQISWMAKIFYVNFLQNSVKSTTNKIKFHQNSTKFETHKINFLIKSIKFGPKLWNFCPLRIKVLNSVYNKIRNYCWYNKHNKKHIFDTNIDQRHSLLRFIADSHINTTF